MKKFNYVYLTTNIVNGKQYVGDHSTNNLNDNYLGSGIYISRAINEHKKENFKRKILEQFNTKQEAFDAQAKYIIEYNTLAPNGYNISPKGGHNVKECWSEQSKKKLSESHKGKKISFEHIQKLRNSNIGRHLSEEHKKAISNASKKQILSEETKKKISKSQKGKKHSLDQNKRHSEKMLGHFVSEETREKKRNSMKGKNTQPRSQETRDKIKKSWQKRKYLI